MLVGNAIREETPKSHQARVVALDSGTLKKLLAHQARQEGDREDAGGRYRDRDFVVAAADGSPIHPDRLSKLFQQEVKDSGGPRIRLHDYADLSVMPTLAGDRWLGAKSAVLMSA